MSEIELQLKLETLLDKHQAWLRQQPEWADLMTRGTRQQRRQAARLLAKELLIIPTATPGLMNRKMRRDIWRSLGGFGGKVQGG